MRDRRDWFRTATGRIVHVLEPDPSVVCLEDIARSLSRQCRFAGHVAPEVDHYSVAQHSVLVSFECGELFESEGLLHDATEAYVQDLIRPIKHSVLGTPYQEVERAWALCIGSVFGLGDRLAYLPASVERADKVLLATERRDLLEPYDNWTLAHAPREARIVPLRAREAYELFMARARGLGLTSRTSATMPAISLERP